METDAVETRHSLQRPPFPLRSKKRNGVGPSSDGVPVLWKTDIMPRSLGCGKHPWRGPRQRGKQGQRRDGETDHLRSSLGVLKAKTPTLGIHLVPPQRQDFAAARSGEEQKLDRRAGDPRQRPVTFHLDKGVTENLDLGVSEEALRLSTPKRLNALGRVADNNPPPLPEGHHCRKHGQRARRDALPAPDNGAPARAGFLVLRCLAGRNVRLESGDVQFRQPAGRAECPVVALCAAQCWSDRSPSSTISCWVFRPSLREDTDRQAPRPSSRCDFPA